MVDAFERAFAGRPAMSAALHLLKHGESIVTPWAGTAPARTGRAWAERTPELVESLGNETLLWVAA